MLAGLFPDRGGVEKAYEAVCRRGYRRIDLNLLMSDQARGRWFPDDAPAPDGGANRPRGGTPVRISLVVSGAGSEVAGLLTLGRIRAGEGGRDGGLVRLLVGWGIPDDRAWTYEAGLLQGGILMEANPRSADDARSLLREWKAAGGEHVHCFETPPDAPRSQGVRAEPPGPVTPPGATPP